MKKTKFKVDIEGSEYKYLPTKKIELIAKREDGEYVISKFENLIKVKATKLSKRNPDKTILFQVRNKMKEQIQIAHYKGNDYLNIFVDAGVHDSRFMLTREQVLELVKTLQHSTIVLCNRDNLSDKPFIDSKN
jgi:predicted RND superfamily exporter protein